MSSTGYYKHHSNGNSNSEINTSIMNPYGI